MPSVHGPNVMNQSNTQTVLRTEEVHTLHHLLRKPESKNRERACIHTGKDAPSTLGMADALLLHG